MMALIQFSSFHLFYFFIITVIIFIISIPVDCLIRNKRIVGGWHAAKPPEDDPVVFVNKNKRDSRIYGKRDPNQGFYVFKGIRFAEPPIGEKRFQRAKAVHLDGEYNATKWAPPCPQNYSGKVIGSEDCLFLNIFTPQLPDLGDGYPVLIWIHGGGFKVGAACQYEMRNLIKKKMIVVSIQYRLGTLGFLSTGVPELPGNNGMFDMLLAVNWVQKYIEYFGGNPNKLVAFGHGTGASAALMLSLSKLTNNLFQGLIAMSGSLLSKNVFDKNPRNNSKMIAESNGCPVNNITNMVHCLQQLPVEQLIDTDSKITNIQLATGFLTGIASPFVPSPVVEGNYDFRSLPNFMTNSPENFLKLGDFPNIPLLTGVMKDESGGAILDGYSDELLNKLKTIPDFLNKELLLNLQQTIPNFQNTSRQFIPKAFQKYLSNDDDDNLKMKLKKVARAVNDAIFTVPAFLTVNYWAKKAKTYFYSFDYASKKRRKNNFLTGFPTVDVKHSSQDENLGHADDLTYIFGQGNDIFGNALSENKATDNNDYNDDDNDDERVSEIFINMIAQFTQIGRIGDVSRANISDSSFTPIPSDSNDDNTFFSITDKLQPIENFKFCEISLWTGAVEKLSSTYCDSLRVTIETVDRLTHETNKFVDIATSSINKYKEYSIDKIKDPPHIGGKTILPNVTSYVPKIPTFFGLTN